MLEIGLTFKPIAYKQTNKQFINARRPSRKGNYY